MITHKGRVVYERIEHAFSTKDIARIVKNTAESKKVADVSRQFTKVEIQYLLDAELTLLQRIAFFTLMINTATVLMDMGVEELMKILAGD